MFNIAATVSGLLWSGRRHFQFAGFEQREILFDIRTGQ